MRGGGAKYYVKRLGDEPRVAQPDYGHVAFGPRLRIAEGDLIEGTMPGLRDAHTFVAAARPLLAPDAADAFDKPPNAVLLAPETRLGKL